MKIKHAIPIVVAVAAAAWLGTGDVWAFHDGKDRSDPAEFGEIGPLLTTHKDAVSSVLVWTGPDRTPKVCFWMRNSQYRGTDLVDPLGFSPNGGDTGGFIDDFRVHVRGGSGFSARLDRNAQSRAKLDIQLDNGLCWDLTHPAAFANNGKFNIANWDPGAGMWIPELVEADFYLNSDAFSNAGHSAGLNFDVFCSGNVQLADGRILFVGGHYIDGNFGIRQLQIFDPLTETWISNAAPPVKTEHLAHPIGDHTSHPHPDANVEVNGDPGVWPAPGIMKYQRWYPSAATLPDGRVLILSGTDDSKNDPFAPRVQNTVPEVYDPETHTTVALENARKALPNYPLVYVVQTGPEKNDWKVAVIGEYRNPPPSPLGAQPPEIDEYNGNTYYLDVLSALADPNRDVPGENHWEGPIATASHAHHRAGAAQIWELKGDGTAKSMKVVAFGGTDGGGPGGQGTVATVEMIDYAKKDLEWKRQQDLYVPADDNDAAVLPDGNVLVVGGEIPGRVTPNYSLHYQMFHPKSGKLKVLGQTSIPRKDHTTMLLLPDASVLVMGSDRPDLIPARLVEGAPRDRDMGVPVAQVYKPSYLFRGPRPVIEWAPEQIGYESSFNVHVAQVPGRSDKIESVVLIRPSPKTHKWDWENRYIKLAFDQKKGTLTIAAPAVPALVVPGYYMLFVLNEAGVPSEAKLVHFSVPE